MLPNLCRNSAATLSQNARSSEPGGWKCSVGSPLEDIHNDGETEMPHLLSLDGKTNVAPYRRVNFGRVYE